MAHIELIGVLPCESCTAINAHIIECWEIKNNVCCPPNTLLTIPTCSGCPSIDTHVGNEYLIAGVQQKINGVKRKVLPNIKETGLFALWDASYNIDIPAWVEIAKN